MDRIRIVGNGPLSGSLPISGAKNAALPLMAASLLTADELVLENVPHLADTSLMAELLANHGVAVSMHGNGAQGHHGRVLGFKADEIRSLVAPYDLVRKMRASFLVAGPLLARFGEATVSQPGGCAIGTRPIDLHLRAFETLGAEVALDGGYVSMRAPKGLRGGVIRFPFVSVGATENALMATALAHGVSVIENAAEEPEVMDLAHCLVAMGARIKGIGSRTIQVEGVPKLHGATYRVLPDRIEAGTFAMAVGVAGGDIVLKNVHAALLGAPIEVLRQAGLEIDDEPDGLRVRRGPERHRAVTVVTEPFPGFPTDLQAQLMAHDATGVGTSRITETIFENRFMHVPELMRMGADISVTGRTAVIAGVGALKGAPVMATDLRASVGLVLAALGAEGETIVNRVYHLDRGFERLEEKLGACGAVIERVKS